MKTGLRYLRPRLVTLSAVCSLVFLCVAVTPADEGMWTFDNPPVKQLQQRYNFTPKQEWLIYLTDAEMASYFRNPRNGFNGLFNLAVGVQFKFNSTFLASRAQSVRN